MPSNALAIIETALPTVLPTLVTAAEKLFGPKTGTVKNAVVTQAVQPLLQAAATAGKLGGPAPIVADISQAVSAVATQLFPSGTTISSLPNLQATTGSISTAQLPPQLASLKPMLRSILAWALSD